MPAAAADPPRSESLGLSAVETSPPRRFENARVRADLTVEELWFRYLALGGTTGLLELEGFLHGLMPLDPLEEDMLAHALNERLAESYNAARIPYRRNAVASLEDEGPPKVLSDL